MTGSEFYAFIKKQIGMTGKVFRTFCGMVSGPWCCAYVTYNFHKTGNKNLFYGGKKVTYCPSAIKWCQAFLAQIPMYLVMPGDIIFFDWNRNKIPDHIGHVKARKSTDNILTHEGNTNGGIVAEKERPAKYVLAIFRPHFKPKKAEKTKLKIDGECGYYTICNLQLALGLKATGILTKATVKAIQKAAGTTPDGAWLVKTSKAVQRMTGAVPDGDFYVESVKALQRWTNAKNWPEEKKLEPAKQSAPKPATKKGYGGTFPTLPTKTAKNAVDMAYAYGTKLSVYKYHGGKPKGSYKTALNKFYPDRKKWGTKARAGASCDVFVGTDLRRSGYSKAPRGLKEQKKWIPKHLSKVSAIRNGDILLRSNHIAVFLELKGGKYVANAHHEKHDGTYAIVEKICSYNEAFRPKGNSYFSKGDTFTQVKNLKKFLNWYGGYKLTEDYSFETATENAVKDFQKKTGLSVTGKFGEPELKKAKAVKK